MRKRRASVLRNRQQEDLNPMHAVANLFDASIVFAVALMVALVSRFNMTELLTQEDFTMVKNPGKANMEIITQEGGQVSRYKASEDAGADNQKKGKRVGTAYQLENGEIIYVPE